MSDVNVLNEAKKQRELKQTLNRCSRHFAPRYGKRSTGQTDMIAWSWLIEQLSRCQVLTCHRLGRGNKFNNSNYEQQQQLGQLFPADLTLSSILEEIFSAGMCRYSHNLLLNANNGEVMVSDSRFPEPSDCGFT